MPRTIALPFRNGLEASRSEEMPVYFLTLWHQEYLTTIWLVNDVVDYIYGGNRYIGFPFQGELITDDDRPPRTSITVQNVDRRIGEFFLEMNKPMRARLDIFSLADFGPVDPVQDARLAIEPEAPPQYTADHLLVRTVQTDPMVVSCEISSWDATQEPWPALRTTRERAPSLYR